MTPSAAAQRDRWSFRALSTGQKMLLALTAALLPLGLIALFASIQSDNVRHDQRNMGARIIAVAEGRKIDLLLLRGSSMIRGMLAPGPLDPVRCEGLLERNAGLFPVPVALALFDAGGRVRCATRGFAARRLPPPRANLPAETLLLGEPDGLRLTVAAQDGSYGVVMFPADLLRREVPADVGASGIAITQGATRLRLTPTPSASIGSMLTVDASLVGTGMALEVTIVANPLTAVQLLLILLPLLMWAAAAAIAWIVMDHLLLRPLEQLQRGVSAFHPGQGPLVLPHISTPSQEIRALAGAFENVAAELGHHEAALEEGMSRQMRLTREVHHRVKNNLQVVASLINLHARGTEGEVAAAYASIQRRVDALAVVHRNHYAEMEDNRGVALRSIIAELTANLRATAPPASGRLTISLDMAQAFITQDVAVPVAFLVTEIVELVMNCDTVGHVAITLAAGDAPDRAILALESASLRLEVCRDMPSHDRFERIITGLSRQLRGKLDYDAAIGRYAIVIMVLPQPGEEKAKNS